MNIVLASKSSRRREILQNLGIPITVLSADVKEDVPDGVEPQEIVMGLAARKLLAAVRRLGGADDFVIAADTVVYGGGKILGKPADAAEAAEMLRLLSGTEHSVYSGIATMYRGQLSVDYDVTRVKFRELTESEINAYVATGEPFDKAGGYGIQDRGEVFCEYISGDFFNVVGLPLCKLVKIMSEEYGIGIFDIIRR